MLYFKACPRCRGDVRFAIDIDGPFVQCLQCGFNAISIGREAAAAPTFQNPARPPVPWKRHTLALTEAVFIRRALHRTLSPHLP